MKGIEMDRKQRKIYKELQKRPGEVHIDTQTNKLYGLVEGGLMIFDGNVMNADFTKMNSEEVSQFIIDTLKK
jgi:hypothetical protein